MGVALRVILVIACASIASTACGEEEEQPLFGPATEAICPTGSSLTYDNFGREFMESYCTRCHSTELTGEDRQGATSFHDFDTLFGIKAVSIHVDFTTASGPAATNDSMPPNGPTPTFEEREQLGEWIACDMP